MLPKQWTCKRRRGYIHELYPHNAKGTIFVYGIEGDRPYALKFFVGDCKGFCPKQGDEVSFVYRIFRALEITKIDSAPCAVVSLDIGGIHA